MTSAAPAAVLVAAILVSLPAFAREAIDTDGPDFVESSEVVPQGQFQYEVDLVSVRDRRIGRPGKGNGIRPSLRSVITWDLPYDMSLGAMPGIKYDTREHARRFTSAIFASS